MVPTRSGHDPLLIQTLKHEFATLTSLFHPNLAQVEDFGMTDQEIFFTSEYVEGRDLLAAAGERNLNTVFQLVLQVLRAVDYLHRRGVLHLDLKPANILITDPGQRGASQVKIIDFGLARLMKDPGVEREGSFGTPPYASPEVLMEQSPLPASDIYSLGMIFHQIFAGRFPFKSQDPLALLQEILYGNPERVSELNPALPDDFSDVLWGMVQKDPRARLKTSREVLDAINASLGERFTLRAFSAPIKILEESDFQFYRPLFEHLFQTFKQGGRERVWLQGPDGSGKNRLLRSLKASLQLAGVFPLMIEGSAALAGAVTAWSEHHPHPRFFTPAREADPIDPILREILDREIPILLAASNRTPPPDFFSSQVEAVPSLTEAELEEFLQEEIAALPQDFVRPMVSLADGNPRSLETVLQSIREEGGLHWTDAGWSWVTGFQVDWDRVFLAQEERWEFRRNRVREVLSLSPVPLSESDLEGMLGLEPGALADRMSQWRRENWLSEREADGDRLFSVVTAAAGAIPSENISGDWENILGELTQLYDQGQHASGGRWVEILIARYPELDRIPLGVRMMAARHAVALGKSEQGLKILPPAPPEGGTERGLYFEIQARAAFNRGQADAALNLAELSRSSYQEGGDPQGLARAWNLTGSIQKRRADPDQAQRAYTEAARMAGELGNGYVQAVAEMNLATIWHDQGKLDQAQLAYQQVLELSRRVSHPTLGSLVRHNWVNLLYHLGRTAEAEGICYEWLQLAIKNRYADQQGAALNYLGLLSGQRGQRDRQLNYLHQAISVLKAGDYPQFLFQTLINRGYVFWSLRNLPAAQLDAEAALDLAEKSGGASFRPYAFLLMGKVLRDRKKSDPTQAGEFFKKALQEARTQNRHQMIWEVQFERALLAKKVGTRDEARVLLLDSKENLTTLMTEMPKGERASFLRDRKLERIESELNELASAEGGSASG